MGVQLHHAASLSGVDSGRVLIAKMVIDRGVVGTVPTAALLIQLVVRWVDWLGQASCIRLSLPIWS
jgi:hypothetical protein